MKTEDVLLIGFGALAGFFLLSNIQKRAGDYDNLFNLRKIEFARHGGDFIPAMPSLPEFKEVPVSISQVVQKFPEETQGIPYVLLETPKKMVEQSVSKVIEEPTKRVKEIAEKTTENIKVASENIKKASEGALDKIKDIAMIGAGAYVGGKTLGFVTKLIPEKRVEKKVLEKVIPKVAPKVAEKGITKTIPKVATKAVKVGTKATTALAIISAGATIGKVIGEATKETEIARNVGRWLAEKRQEKSIVGAVVDTFLKIGEFANKWLSFI